MSRTWKWILGIVIGLVILAGIGFVAANYFGFGHMAYFGRTAYSGHPMMDGYGFGDRGPTDGFRNFRHPMMGGRGFYPFGGFFILGGLLRLIFPLAILVAVGYFAYQKGKKDGIAKAATNAPQVEPPASDEEN
ncbi:MAG: hypothetical protein PVJ21_23070 [Anaerolineales bacterium]|jgi:hypothetical protein